MTAQSLSRTEIEGLLPHRGDALFLASAEVDGLRASGQAVWSSSHPHINGHFPGSPIVPGIFLIEAAVQLSGVALAAQKRHARSGQTFGVLAGVRKALFHRPVRPAQPIHFEITLVEPSVGPFVRASGHGYNVKGLKVLSLELTIAVVERATLLAG